MRSLRIWQVDAFALAGGDGRALPFTGNPAAVVPLESWPADEVLRAIALENNLSETAFLLPRRVDGMIPIRWFTPAVEVALCGHATLASAQVVLDEIEPGGARVVFDSLSGPLPVERGGFDAGGAWAASTDGAWFQLDFPALPCAPGTADDAARLAATLGVAVLEAHVSERRWIAVLADAGAVASLRPDFAAIARLEKPALVVTARAGADAYGADFVSRHFGPNAGVAEDPATGSAHCTLAPFWAARVGRTALTGRQLSARGGELRCAVAGDRVLVAGRVAPYLHGEIVAPA